MKILGIGNAIVDVICKVDETFITQNNLVKSTMKLVNEEEFKKILSPLKIEQTVSGGSVANSIVGLSQLGNNVGFIGKINDDVLGNKYEEGLSCPNWHDKLTEIQKSRFRMRQSQIYKAKQSRKKHIFQKEFK